MMEVRFAFNETEESTQVESVQSGQPLSRHNRGNDVTARARPGKQSASRGERDSPTVSAGEKRPCHVDGGEARAYHADVRRAEGAQEQII